MMMMKIQMLSVTQSTRLICRSVTSEPRPIFGVLTTTSDDQFCLISVALTPVMFDPPRPRQPLTCSVGQEVPTVCTEMNPEHNICNFLHCICVISMTVWFKACLVAFFFQGYITEFLRSLSQQPCYTMFSQHHNDSEKQVLRTIGIHV